MDRAFCARRFLPAEGAFIKALPGILQEPGTVPTKPFLGLMVSGAVYPHHRVNGPVFCDHRCNRDMFDLKFSNGIKLF